MSRCATTRSGARWSTSRCKLQQDFRNFDFLSPWEGMTTLPGDEKVHLNRIAAPEKQP